MGYESGKIYKLICEDGTYYIGSTVRSLSSRLASHKHASKASNTSTAYAHINTIGWDHVRIQLIELFPCESKDQLLQRESWHIGEAKHDNACLNTRSPVAVAEVHREQCKEYYRQHRDAILESRRKYHEEHREERANYNKEYAVRNAESLKEYYRQYAIENRERRNQLARERRARNRLQKSPAEM